MSGRLDNGHLVHVEGDSSLVGSIRRVKIIDAMTFYLVGEIINE